MVYPPTSLTGDGLSKGDGQPTYTPLRDSSPSTLPRNPAWTFTFCSNNAHLHSRRALQSASTSRLVVPVKHSAVGGRTFHVSGTICLKMLQWRCHCQSTSVDRRHTSSRNHTRNSHLTSLLTLSVVLAMILVTQVTLKITELNRTPPTVHGCILLTCLPLPFHVDVLYGLDSTRLNVIQYQRQIETCVTATVLHAQYS